MHKLSPIKKGHGGIDFKDNSKVTSSIFLYLYCAGVIIFFCVLVMRLFQLTVVKGEYYSRLADGNRTRDITIEARRGTIVDRKGVVVAENLPADLHASGTRLFSVRKYTEPEAVAPLVGYRQTADTQDTKTDACLTKIMPGDKVGKKGVEKTYECDLRGVNGKKLMEIDASGKLVRTLAIVPAQDGKTMQLAMDLEIQKKAHELLKDKHGAIVVLKPQTGEVLALASSPTFNIQDFEVGDSGKITTYFSDKDKPMFNRATEGTYPPGSVFKLVVAAGALEEKKIDEKTEIEDTGEITAGPIKFGNWYYLEYGRTEGQVDIVKAIQRSNDIFFYKTGERLGDVGIKSWAERFGYGSKTGIGIDEAMGIVPSDFWKEEVLKEQWYLGDTYNYSIGQGYLLVTPLQVAQATAVIANDGLLCHPQLRKVGSGFRVQGSEKNAGTTNPEPRTPNCKKLNISQKTLDLIHEGMTAACAPGGTGWPLFNYKVPVACKTGTAESSTAGSATPHAWFTAYAPVKDPEIEVTVVVEQSGQGSDIGGPIAKELLNVYFDRKQ